jgi:S-adenosylmethionine/arginine decarboxylase-like enzyme
MTTKEKSVSKVGKDDIKNIGEPFRLGWRFCAFSILCASALSSSTGRMCRSELERPLSPSHPLFGLHEIFGIKSDSSLKLDTELVTSRIIAMGTSRDDVVEVLPDGSTSKYHGTTRTLYSTELSSQPTVEHLLVDVAKLDVSFLKSQKETGHIVTQLASSSGLALLSYQCHELQPSGHACIGIMSDSSHITLRTWPEHGVMSLDLFAGKKIDMLELISFMEELLREHQSDSLEGKETPRINWITKRRGFQRSIGHRNSTDVSSNTLLQRPMSFEMKQKVAFVETQYQRAEIFDVIEERFERSPTHCTGLNDSGFVSYCIKHPELFRPDRILCKYSTENAAHLRPFGSL